MWFWSEISRMFLFCVFGVDFFKGKKCVFYRLFVTCFVHYKLTRYEIFFLLRGNLIRIKIITKSVKCIFLVCFLFLFFFVALNRFQISIQKRKEKQSSVNSTLF